MTAWSQGYGDQAKEGTTTHHASKLTGAEIPSKITYPDPGCSVPKRYEIVDLVRLEE